MFQICGTYDSVDLQAQLLDDLAVLFSDHVASGLRADVLVLATDFGLGAWGPEWRLELLALEEARGHVDSVDGASALVLGPAAAGDVAANNGLERENFEAADGHGTVAELSLECGWEVGRDCGGDEVGFEIWDALGEEREPVGGEEGQECALLRDALIGMSECALDITCLQSLEKGLNSANGTVEEALPSF